MVNVQEITLCKKLINIDSVVPKNYNASIILEFEEKICLELYSNIKQLGRVMLRASGETLAVGVVMELIG